MESSIHKKCSKCSKSHEETTKLCATCKERKRVYRNKNKERIREQQRASYAANPEPKKANAMRRYAEKGESIRLQTNTKRADDPDKINAQNKASQNRREGKMNKIKDGAKQRGHDITMTDDEIMNMTDLPCVYCAHETEDRVFRNGIDRLDSSIGYEISNCVPCCGYCNKSKGVVDPLTFVERARQISLYHGFNGDITDNWSNINKQKFEDYKYTMLKSNKIFKLSKEEFEDLREKNCHYCGRSSTNNHSNGIDCVDPNPEIGYVISNCVPACRDCNFMKNSMEHDFFINLMKKIALCDYEFPDVSRVLTTFTRKNTKK
jgi:5-methylcytosine-specific restriction endonuclease McrA